jgi:DNA repair photolyase
LFPQQELITKYRDRVTISLSVTAALENSAVISVIEPGASPITERLRVLQQAHAMRLRTYAMLCPLMPGIADGADQIDALVTMAVDYGAEEIFAEPVNPRGRGLILTQQALEQAGYHAEASKIKSIRSRLRWSGYVAALIRNLQQSVRKYSDISKLRILLYPKGLESHDVALIQKDDAGVVWLGSKM